MCCVVVLENHQPRERVRSARYDYLIQCCLIREFATARTTFEPMRYVVVLENHQSRGSARSNTIT